MASILKVDTIQDQDGNNIINESGDTITIGASGDTITVPTGASLTVPNGGLSGQNYPAFEAHLSDDQTVADNTAVKIQVDNVDFDTDSCYDNTTNYRFTPTVAGKYFVYGSIRYSNANAANFQTRLHKNGSLYKGFFTDFTDGTIDQNSYTINAVIDCNGSTDYIELFTVLDVTSGTPLIVGQTASRVTGFGAFRIGD